MMGGLDGKGLARAFSPTSSEKTKLDSESGAGLRKAMMSKNINRHQPGPDKQGEISLRKHTPCRKRGQDGKGWETGEANGAGKGENGRRRNTPEDESSPGCPERSGQSTVHSSMIFLNSGSFSPPGIDFNFRKTSRRFSSETESGVTPISFIVLETIL